MLPLLILGLLAAVVNSSPSPILNHNHDEIFFETPIENNFGRRYPRSTQAPFAVQPVEESKSISQGIDTVSSLVTVANSFTLDLTPQAQSYFYEPELPTTSSVRPTFKRRKTHRPITSLSEKKTSQSDTNPEELSSPAPFKPNKQSGFAKRRPSSATVAIENAGDSQRSRNRANSSPSSNINYELNEINTTTEGQQEPTPKEEGHLNNNLSNNKNANNNHFARRKFNRPSGIGGTTSSTSPIVNRNRNSEAVVRPRSPQVKIDRPNRFTSSRRRSTKAPFLAEAQDVSDSPAVTQSGQTLTSRQPAKFSKDGRKGFILRPKPQGQPQATPSSDLGADNNADNDQEGKPLRRRKRPTTETSIPENVKTGNGNENPSEAPRQVPSEPANIETVNEGSFQSNRNPNLRRRPGARLQRNNEQSVVAESGSLNARSRNPRQRQPKLGSVADSIHEPSEIVETHHEGTVVDPPEDVPSDNDTPAVGGYRPRNLSNRPGPLDKLHNRQAAARRFLTPKKPTDQAVSTAAPAQAKKFSLPPRKAPLSLQNLRNRRLGQTSSTTEAPAEAEGEQNDNEHGKNEDIDQELAGEAAGNGGDKASETKIEKTEEGEKHEDVGQNPEFDAEQESSKPPEGIKGLLRSGNRKPLMSRIALPKPQTTTTVKPASDVSTTPAPTCEDGKRWNKVLRKCIPAYNPRPG